MALSVIWYVLFLNEEGGFCVGGEAVYLCSKWLGSYFLVLRVLHEVAVLKEVACLVVKDCMQGHIRTAVGIFLTLLILQWMGPCILVSACILAWIPVWGSLFLFAVTCLQIGVSHICPVWFVGYLGECVQCYCFCWSQNMAKVWPVLVPVSVIRASGAFPCSSF